MKTKTKLEEINIMPSFGKIQAMSESAAKHQLYTMQSIAASLAFELFINENYGVSSLGKSEFIDELLQHFSSAATKTGEQFTQTK